MRKISYIFAFFTAMLLVMSITSGECAAEPQCSGCHISMAANPIKLPDSPPANLISALQMPCKQYSRVLEEWYYVEELFVTTEHHLEVLEHDRFHLESLKEQLVSSRDLLRATIKQPVVSLADFQQKTGKLRFDVGRIYRDAKAKTIEQRDRDVFGIVLICTLLMLFIIVTGWRVSSGSGIVHPTKTKLGYDDYMEQLANEKEAAE